MKTCPYCGNQYTRDMAEKQIADEPGEELLECPYCEKWAWDAGFQLVPLANPKADTR